MDRKYYLGLAADGLRMPIGTHLVLHRHVDHAVIELNGERLGAVLVETAARFRTPLAVPLMDLTLEKSALLQACGIATDEVDHHHFTSPPIHPESIPLTPRMRASCEAIAHVAKHSGLVPLGMCIGPFSLLTKLLADPITPVFLAGSGHTAADEPEVALLDAVHALAETVIHRYLDAQLSAGAKAVIVCEPAANLVYFSPKQLATNFAVFDRLVMEPMRRIAARLRDHGADLIFHDCGELTDEMLRRFATLDPAVLSLGSSRKLWEDAALLPKTTVLYGNLPTKRFYSPQLTRDDVAALARELRSRMAAVAHPFILGSECDVLSVPGSEAAILDKVDAFMDCA